MKGQEARARGGCAASTRELKMVIGRNENENAKKKCTLQGKKGVEVKPKRPFKMVEFFFPPAPG